MVVVVVMLVMVTGFEGHDRGMLPVESDTPAR